MIFLCKTKNVPALKWLPLCAPCVSAALMCTLQKYKMTEKPKGKLQDKIDVAVDSIVQLTIGTAQTILCQHSEAMTVHRCPSQDAVPDLPLFLSCHG